MRKSIRLILLLGSVLPGTGMAQQTPPPNLPTPPPLPPEVLKQPPLQPPANLPDPSELFAQLQQLEELLSLPPDKLSRLRQTVEFIERMSADEREAMRIRLSQITRVTPQLRQEIEDLSGLLPRDAHSALSQFWLAASPDERDSIRTELAALPQEEQTRLLSAKVDAFVERRDAVFEKMRQSLESKRLSLPPANSSKP